MEDLSPECSESRRFPIKMTRGIELNTEIEVFQIKMLRKLHFQICRS